MDIIPVSNHLKPVSVGRILFHMSNPFFRDSIKNKGLIPQGKSDAWLSDTNIEGSVIFLSNHENPLNWFDSGYDDDIYKIDTSNLDNVWYEDPNFSDQDNSSSYVITFSPIPYTSIELVYAGTGDNTDDLPSHPYIQTFLDKK